MKCHIVAYTHLMAGAGRAGRAAGGPGRGGRGWGRQRGRPNELEARAI